MVESVLLSSALAGVAYLYTVTRRSRKLHKALSSNARGMSGHLHTSHPALGHCPVPGAQGFDYFPIGPDVPIRFDSQGFRIPVDGPESSPSPDILCLGCSFTFGQGCTAEETWPFQLGQLLGRSVVNAGVCGYGLQHSLLQARDLIPRLRPRAVVLQLSPWQLLRGELTFSPTSFGHVPCPYFTEGADGELTIAPPAYGGNVHDLPVWKYRGRTGELGQRYRFLFDVGLRLFPRDDLQYLRYRGRKALGGVPEPSTARQRIVDAALQEIDDLCAQVGATLYVMTLTAPSEPDFGPLLLPRGRAFRLVDVDSAILGGAPVQVETYVKLCGQWRGEPPVLVDGHPNAPTHRTMAEVLAEAIRREEASPGSLLREPRPEHTWILGLSAYYHDSAACLLRDGEIVAAAQEERFTRVKADHRFPHAAVSYCLREAGIRLEEIDHVVYYEKPLVKFTRLLETYAAMAPRGFASFTAAMPIWLREKLFLKKVIQRELGGRTRSLLFTEHHESHAASAFFPSPFEEAAILCLDGVGEWQTTTAWTGQGHRLTPLWELRFPHSLGLLYSAFTYYTGFKVNSGEYKVMGLAPYGRPLYVQAIYDHLVDLKPDGTFRLNMEYFDYCTGSTMTNEKFHALFGGPPREPETLLTQKEMDLARSVQEVTEEIMLRLARTLHAETGMKNLCLAGGVALNCVANGRLLREGPFENLWIQPAAGDAGGALGAALVAWHEYLGHERRAQPGDSMRGAYLGPSFSSEEIERFLQGVGASYERVPGDGRLRRLARDLADGKVIGWFAGRMEFGPRALGSRSILGDARSPRMQALMNLKIKFRESFRPFAPCVLAERVSDYFEMDVASPYMLLVADVRKERRTARRGDEETLWGIDLLNVPRSDIPAVTHVDYSARVQTVHRETNPAYYGLLKEFEELTGYGVLVNTSFNVRGEPIVCTPEDAWRCFMRTDIDVLVLEDFVLEKSRQPELPKDESWMKEFSLD